MTMEPDLPQKAASDRRFSHQSASFFQWKGLLFLFVLLLLPSAVLSLGLDPAQTEKLLHPAPLLELVPGPAPSAPSDEAASGIKNVKKPPAKTKSPRELEEEAALRKRARRAADRYTLSNKTFFDHILARHGAKSTVPGKSRFVKDFDVRTGIDFVLKSPDARIRANTEGRRGFIFEVTYHKKIGISPEKKPLKTLRVVIDEAGRVITAFPVK
ncbi:MAG: hypothetical protein MPW16_16815 [Candidatus Manganitrophus sp.]|nr:MAG: hypothetical protein MPW16_16815 [Candidatus Manganitrophus sp.]